MSVFKAKGKLPSGSSVFANLETLIGRKNKIIHSNRHDIEPPV